MGGKASSPSLQMLEEEFGMRVLFELAQKNYPDITKREIIIAIQR